MRLTCGVLGHSTQAYYAWLATPVSQREVEDAYVTNALIDAHGDDPEFAAVNRSDSNPLCLLAGPDSHAPDRLLAHRRPPAPFSARVGTRTW